MLLADISGGIKMNQYWKWITWACIASVLFLGRKLPVQAAEPVAEGTMQLPQDENQSIEEGAVPSSGEETAENPQDLQLEMLTSSILDSITTPEMTDGEKFVVCYQYILDSCSYKRSYDTPEGDWTKGYAIELLSTGRGNCYRYAAGLASLAEAIGYDAKVVTGEIGSRKGGMTPHGWTEVLIGDTWYVFDAVRQDASKQKNYFGQTYETYPGKPIVKEQEWELDF